MEHYRQKIALRNARFYAYHGYYEEEQLIGNEFFLDVICFVQKPTLEANDNLANTINYEELYRIAKDEMDEPKKLLETIVENILNSIKITFSEVNEIEVTLRKSNPPFGGDTATAEVSLFWQRN
ncbi:dihydroneopterin aldolase [Olivibacter sp. XZL3]|uniref:dihydroneopterin aldolase n=1 Tax=Olivibacter sp. XZL3 TaxID=1735116 RepID=UPI001065946A|nr:dihydroneopterin aldolase [Olivibacter sp. XZL3]